MPDDAASNQPGNGGSDNGSASCTPVRSLLSSHPVIIAAYATSMIILASALAVLIVTIAVLCFFYPDKANAFLMLLGGPVAALLVVYSGKAKNVTIQMLSNGKQSEK